MYLIYSTWILLLLNVISRHSDTFIWHEFNSMAIETVLLQLPPLMIICYHFLSAVESAICKVLLVPVWGSEMVHMCLITCHEPNLYSSSISKLAAPRWGKCINPLNTELNPICYLLALLAHHFLHISRIRVKSLTLRLLMSYIYGVPILDVSRSHTTTQHSR